MIKDKINSLQFAAMMAILLIASFIGIGMFSIVKAAGVDTYLSIIIAAIFGIFIIISFFVIFDYEPSLSITLKLTKIFGKFFGNILNFICIIIVLTMGISAMYNLTTFISSQFLKETPLLFIGACFSLVIILVNFKGIETLSRVGLIIFFINFVLFFLAVIGLLPQFQVSNLKPFLEFGIGKPMIGAVYNILLNLLPIYFLLIIPKEQLVNKEKYRKYIIIFYIISVIIKLIFILLTLGVLGIHLTSIYQYPEYIVLKRIKLFNFIDKIENVITIQWLFGLFFNISLVVYYVSHSIVPKRDTKILPILITVIILFCSIFLFKNNTVFNEYTYTKVPYIRGILFFIYILLFIGVLISRKRKRV